MIQLEFMIWMNIAREWESKQKETKRWKIIPKRNFISMMNDFQDLSWIVLLGSSNFPRSFFAINWSQKLASLALSLSFTLSISKSNEQNDGNVIHCWSNRSIEIERIWNPLILSYQWATNHSFRFGNQPNLNLTIYWK